MKQVIIYGELHTKEERDRVERLIRMDNRAAPFDFILSEEAGNNILDTPDKLRRAIKERNYAIGPGSYELALKFGIPCIGIDVWDDKIHQLDRKDKDGFYVDCSYSFAVREKQMLSVIREYAEKGRCAVLLGDSHIRTKPNRVMGPASIIYATLRDTPSVIFVRSPIAEAE